MIPKAAVEAAFLRIAEHLDDTEEESWRDLLRTALEAAAPHIASSAWSEGFRACNLEWEQEADIADADDERLANINPYRK